MSNHFYARGTEEAKIVLVIETLATRGSGTEEEPYRFVRQYWDLEGKLLAEADGKHET